MVFKNFRLTLIRLWLSILVLLPLGTHASHLMGGEITWTCLKNGNDAGKFIFQLKLYRYCAGANLSTSTSIGNPLYGTWGGTATITMPQISATDLSINCGDSLLAMDCYDPYRNANSIEERIYESAPVVLYGVPKAYPTGSEFGFSICCRPGSPFLINISSSGYYIRSKMFAYTNPLTGVPDTLGTTNAPSCYDSSPTFAERPAITLCTGNLYHYSHNAWDPEIDSLVYFWGDPMSSPSQQSTWRSGYSSSSQLPGTAVYASNIPATLDPSSGEVKFKTDSPAGLYSTVIKVFAYKGKQPVAEIYRDVGISIINCNNTNAPPIVDFRKCGSCPLITSPAGDTVYAGDSVNFIINSTDIGFLPGNYPQKNFLLPSGIQFGYRFGDPDSGCLYPPCAVLDTTNAFYVSSANNWSGLFGITTTFSWKTDCDHLPLVNNYFVNSSKHTFVFKVHDNFCPVPAADSKTFTITILAPPSIPPPKLKCSKVLAEGIVQLSWSIPFTSLTDSFNSFQYYTIYRSNGTSGPYALIDSIDDINTTTYIDSFLDFNNDYYYVIKGLSSCHSQSERVWSDTISAMVVRGSVLNEGNTVALEWTSFSTGNNFPQSTIPEYLLYEIHGIDTTLISRSAIARDTISYTSCYPDTLKYFVEVIDTTSSWGCTSRSSVLEMVIGDQGPPPVQELDSVSIDQFGLAILGWQRNSAADLDYYLVGYCEGGNFILLDTLPSTSNNYQDLTGGILTESTSYAVIAVDTCANSSLENDEFACHSTINLTAQFDRCAERINLEWNPYDYFQSGSDQLYRIYVSIDRGTWQLLDETASAGYSFHQVLDSTEYCFYLQAWEHGGSGPISSSSNRECVEVNLVVRPEFSHLDYVTVNGNAQIDLCFRSEVTDDVERYNVRRATNNEQVFDTIYSYLLKNPMDPGDSMLCYSDYTAEVALNSYTYYVDVIDHCKQVIDSSNLGRSMLLDVNWTAQNVGHLLNWNKYIDWPTGVEEYKLFFGYNENNMTEILSLAGGTATKDHIEFKHALGLQIADADEYCYQVMAVEKPPYVRKTTAAISLSNTFCLRNRQGLFIPNTFTPNEDDINEVFKPIGIVRGMKFYRFVVFNRWGDVLFETTNADEGWDGKYKGNLSQNGSYVYSLSYLPEGKNAKLTEVKGKFNLLR